MPESTNDTIASNDVLALRHQRFAYLARWIFFRVVGRRSIEGIGTLHVHEQWGSHLADMTVGSGDLVADITLKERGAYAALVYGGSRGMGRSYVNGQWDSKDMTSLVRFLFRATQPRRQRQDRRTRRRRLFWSFAPLGRRLTTVLAHGKSSTVTDRQNIHAHYDLSNEFFGLMLDETMAYSCAIFKDASTSLHDAQVEKFDRLCRKLQLGPGDHVLEIGTGWGGFAMHAASRYGARVTTTTISQNQREEAQRRVNEAGLDHLVTVLGDHYRELTGTYDALVSVEMIEAVSWRNYDEFFKKCSSLLTGKGRMALQAITIADQSFERAKVHKDFIRDLIFPGGCLPSVTAIMNSVANVTDLMLIDLDDIGVHYAKTLRLWGQNVDERFHEMRSLGFDDRFKRLWEMYLRYCEAAFLERHISDVQLVFHKPEVSPLLGYRPS
jgi:cyclopropane-fatty-acyl-phospholipid synthase